MSRLGHTTHKYYKETRGVKVSGGQNVKAGTVLTRQGHKWKPGHNVIGLNHLTAGCDGEVYFTKTKNRFKKVVTYIHIKPNKN
jgi:ribosomal protein L27